MKVSEELTYITSDLHLNHSNIIKFCNRPFRDIKQMDEYIFRQIDALPENSQLINLGDVAMAYRTPLPVMQYYVSRMKKNNKKLVLILGNHDREVIKGYEAYDYFMDAGFDRVYEHPILLERYGIILSHEPIFLTEEMPYFNVHGHIHNSIMTTNYFEQSCALNRYINACVDVNGFAPIKLNDILSYVEKESTK
jgi:calcineurin-like phosphoesterase family protein